jgi:mono/diheme cytochrome c family protein
MRTAAVAFVWGSLFAGDSVSAATLSLEGDHERVIFETAELLARPDAEQIQIPEDVSYGRPSSYRAIPLAALLARLPPPPGRTLEAVARDGYAAQIPMELAYQDQPGAARAWLAIDRDDAPWPTLPGKHVAAGPFYIVWERPEASGVPTKYWTHQLATLRYVLSPSSRWPQLAVDASLPAGHPARIGQQTFVTQCLPCHMLNGGGTSTVGPDLNVPMNPTQYFQDAALRRYLRDPASVRRWPDQKMPGFTLRQLSETELNAVVEYLAHMAPRGPG